MRLAAAWWGFAAAAAPAAAAPPALWAWLSGHEGEALAQLAANRGVLTDVSIGGYGVGSDGALTGGPNVTLLGELRRMGLRTHPLVGCGSTAALRTLFASPGGFIAGITAQATALGFDGINLDFEPYDGAATNADGAAYGRFLTKLADALHGAGKVLSLDYFSNVPVWDLAAMNASSADRFISMDTYVQGNESFTAYMQVAKGHLDPRRLGVGMCASLVKPGAAVPYGPNPCGDKEWTPAMLAERFAFLDAAFARGEFSEVAMWVLPLTDAWWAALRGFAARWRGAA